MTGTRRCIGGWGFEGETYPPSPQFLAWLDAQLGPTRTPFPRFDRTRLSLPQAPRLPHLVAPVSLDATDRLVHARGQGLTDLLKLRSGSVPAFPAAVARPSSDAEVEAVLKSCAHAGLRVIPWVAGPRSLAGSTSCPTRCRL